MKGKFGVNLFMVGCRIRQVISLGCEKIGNNDNRGLFLVKAGSRKLLAVPVFEILRLV